jgi:3',5'-cyclic AMP phosphodiesterase CpdA
VTVKLAHFSDLHLGPLPREEVWRDFRLKRVVGGLSWAFNRRFKHRVAVANALREDIQKEMPDHVAFTGDGVNIASPFEFSNLMLWMDEFGAKDWISYTPGNHDAYVPIDWPVGLGKLEGFMQSDTRQLHPFPFIRLRRNVALIGVNSAEPRGLYSAEGSVGATQMLRLAARLEDLRHKGFYRVVMIHHPPAPGLALKLRSLTDAAALKTLLCHEKTELVIHGHNHVRSFNWIEENGNRVPVVGVASASLDEKQHHPAEWNTYEISRMNGRWSTQVKIKRWGGSASGFKTAAEFEIAQA